MNSTSALQQSTKSENKSIGNELDENRIYLLKYDSYNWTDISRNFGNYKAQWDGYMSKIELWRNKYKNYYNAKILLFEINNFETP